MVIRTIADTKRRKNKFNWNMKVNLGEVNIEIVDKPIFAWRSKNGSDSGGARRVKTMNCIFTKGFSNGKGGREVKNFYFYLEVGRGLIFKGGMEWSPYQLKDYMEFLKVEYLELETINQNSEITAEEFLGFLLSKRRTEIIDVLNEE